jgi:hypothetical protein
MPAITSTIARVEPTSTGPLATLRTINSPRIISTKPSILLVFNVCDLGYAMLKYTRK